MAYALVAYQTAWLKANHPVEFMCAMLSNEMGDLKKVAVYIGECRDLDIDVLPPDINRSESGFSVEDAAIRFGLNVVKNVGEGPCQAIVEEREQNGPYKDVFDFCARLSGQTISSRLIESLNKAGAFLSTQWNRRQVAEVLDIAISAGQSLQRERDAGQTSLFDLAGAEDVFDPGTDRPDLPEWPEHEVLAHEKEMLGLYVSSHPLNNYETLIRRFHTLDLNSLEEKREGDEAIVCGIIVSVRKIYNRKNEAMAFLALETLQGPCDITVFSDLYEQKKSLLIEDMIISCPVRVNIRDEKHTLIAENILAIDESEGVLARALHVRLKPEHQAPDLVHKLACLLGNAKGDCDVFLHCLLPDKGGEAVVHATSACRVAPSERLALAIEALLGADVLFLSAGMGLPSHRPPRENHETPRRFRRKTAASA